MDDERSLPGPITAPPAPEPARMEPGAPRLAKPIWPRFERVAWHDGGVD